ncbi:MAG TPA: ABC transporter permease [Candidatus Dormibacteraeota bacterium]|jgi:hypothetical protein|nr:ABC transporter permease [Candidatus Dormibacteraeota bacterium]
MRNWITVARWHLVQPLLWLAVPWAVVALNLAVNVLDRAISRPGPSGGQTGSVATIFIIFLLFGVLSMVRSLPFALAMGISRRSYYGGTLLLAVSVALVDGLLLAILQAVERATGGWGVYLRFFRVEYLLQGPWYLTWLTSFVVLTLIFVYGMWFGLVHRRWNVTGLLGFVIGQVVLAAIVVQFVDLHTGWSGVGSFFTAVTVSGTTGLAAVVALVLIAGGYAVIRRASV